MGATMNDEDIDRLCDAMHEILSWAKAYSETMFAEVTDAEWEAARPVLAVIHPTLIDRMHAHWGRHLMDGVGKIAREALSHSNKGIV